MTKHYCDHCKKEVPHVEHYYVDSDKVLRIGVRDLCSNCERSYQFEKESVEAQTEIKLKEINIKYGLLIQSETV